MNANLGDNVRPHSASSAGDPCREGPWKECEQSMAAAGDDAQKAAERVYAARTAWSAGRFDILERVRYMSTYAIAKGTDRSSFEYQEMRAVLSFASTNERKAYLSSAGCIELLKEVCPFLQRPPINCGSGLS